MTNKSQILVVKTKIQSKIPVLSPPKAKTKFSNRNCVKSLIIKLLSSRILSQTAKISLYKTNFNFWVSLSESPKPKSNFSIVVKIPVHSPPKAKTTKMSKSPKFSNRNCVKMRSNFELSISCRVEIQIRNQLQVKLLSPNTWNIIHVKFLLQSQNIKTKNYFLRPQICRQFADYQSKMSPFRIAANARYLRFFRD